MAEHILENGEKASVSKEYVYIGESCTSLSVKDLQLLLLQMALQGAEIKYLNIESPDETIESLEKKEKQESVLISCFTICNRLHRRDGPALEYSDGTKKWYWEGLLHRIDGPAIEWGKAAGPLFAGSKEWWEHNVWKKTERYDMYGRLHSEHSDKVPAISLEDGSEYWYIHGLLSREDGPAVVFSDRSTFWYKNGKLHRENGPAVEYKNGNREWWIDGRRVLVD